MPKIFGKKTQWTEESILREIKQFKDIKTWRELSPKSYMASSRRGTKFHKIATKHMKGTKWSKKIDILNEAKMHKGKFEWSKKSSGSYYAAIRLGEKFFKRATSHMINTGIKWNRDTIIADASMFKTRQEWINSSGGSAEQAAKRLGILKEVSSHFEIVGIIT